MYMLPGAACSLWGTLPFRACILASTVSLMGVCVPTLLHCKLRGTVLLAAVMLPQLSGTAVELAVMPSRVGTLACAAL
jgi:hypothetical protein